MTALIKRPPQAAPPMKHYTPKTMSPNTDQFHQLVKEQISIRGQQSLAYKLLLNLFQQAEALFHSLDFLTAESLSVFRESGQYLSPQQERDALALTAYYVTQLKTHLVHQQIQQDLSLSESERLSLTMALDTFRATAEANCTALGHPQWVRLPELVG
jgi:hypothetical protein